MSELIRNVLSGSCTPASELLRLVRTGKVERAAAQSALNARLGRRAQSLEDAAQSESSYMRRMDI